MLPKNPRQLSLARKPTPIHPLKKVSAALGKSIYIWRDDLTGFNGSGNKIRKLEFLLADALEKGADWIVTCGGPGSNHTRATTAAARELGIGTSVLILPRPGFDPSAPATGNLLLNQIFGAQIRYLDPQEFQNAGGGYDSFLNSEMEIQRSRGKNPYLIPLGGSNAIGCFGYQSAVSEMLTSWREVVSEVPAPASIFCALGSGGTYTGLQMGIESQNLSTNLYGVNVIGPIETATNYLEKIQHSLAAKNLSVNLDRANIIDGYVGEGYALASREDLVFYRDLASSEGILLDPCYTGKAFRAMISEIQKNPSDFGEHILFLHSGGGFGNFAYAEQYQAAFRNSY